MTEKRPPFWQIKLSSKGQITVPAEVIAEMGLAKGKEYVYLFLDDRVIRVVAIDLFPELLQTRRATGDTVTREGRKGKASGRLKKA